MVPLGNRDYDKLREFVHDQEDEARCKIYGADHEARRRGVPGTAPSFVFFANEMERVSFMDGDVQWVLNGQKKAWLDAKEKARLRLFSSRVR